MPDFNIECHYVCDGIGSAGNVGGYHQSLENVPYCGPCWVCSCKAFQFQKKPVSERSCKHLEEFHRTRCTWEQIHDGGEPIDGKCPKCGGLTRVERYAV